jgi:hypothetical protein
MQGNFVGLVIPGFSKHRSALAYTEDKGAPRTMRPSRRHLPQYLKHKQHRSEKLKIRVTEVLVGFSNEHYYVRQNA